MIVFLYLRGSLLAPFRKATLLIIGFPRDRRQSQVTLNTSAPSSSPSGGLKRARPGGEHSDNQEDDHSNGNPKKRRNVLYHPHRAQCLPCVLWRQSGSDPNLKHFHPLKNSRHVGTEAVPLSRYAEHGSTHFHLTSNDCVCQPCYKDFQRKHNQENSIPRWAKVKEEHYSASDTKHCMYCCEGNCACQRIRQWGPENWYGENTSIQTWKKYLSLTGKIEHNIGNHANHLCRTHYRRVFKLKELRACSICKSCDSSSWKLLCDVAPSPDPFCEAFQLPIGSVHFFSWVCGQCRSCYADDVQLEDQLEDQLSTDVQSSDPMTSQKSQLLLSILHTLKTDGVVFTKDVMKQYRTILINLDIPLNQHNQLCKSISKYLSKLCKHNHCQIFVPAASSGIFGRALYDHRKFSAHSINYLFEMKKIEWKSQLSTEYLNSLLRKQISLFPTSKDFDYTKLISNDTNVMEIDKYFDPELFNFLDTITTSRNSHKHSSSDLYKDLRTARIRMVIAIMCNTMNPTCCFLQTITGLLCYAYGLRDKGFEALNAFGCCCSIDHVRSHGTFWASRKQPILHLDGNQPWRGTIDNLNFYMKFSKNLPESATGPNKMLNLLTCQVSHQTSHTSVSSQTGPFKPLSLKQLAYNSLKTSVTSSCSTPLKRNEVTVGDFDNHAGCHDYYLQYFLAVCHVCTANRLSLLPIDHTTTFLEALQGFMPHWTPCRKDNVVYATIKEAQSGTIGDVEEYLYDVKRDLHIGEPGYPEKITMAGDQQTYAIMKQLQKQHPDHYKWMIVLHGDWHTLQLLAEMLRDILWDGGFKQMCHECGYKKIPTQWQEIHMLLMALHQALLHKAMLAYSVSHEISVGEYKKFWDWLTKVASDSNQDENSKFWARMVPFLNGYSAYFIAIRSGNWVLRNSSIKLLTPLFFAYGHYKYEELASTAILDALTVPEDVLAWFLMGGWTVSAKGKPHHNLALDEAHESMVNLRLKTITSRPSHFRTVEMANFMSYLDIIVRGVEDLLYFQKKKDPSEYRKRYICQRATKINQLLKDTPLFTEQEEVHPLRNVLCPEKVSLDSKSTLDLLNIATIGRERMTNYVKEYILPQPTTARKRRKRSRKLATFTKKSSTASESKRREQELSNIATNAIQILQANGITAQTSPYPLAISDLDGNLRSSGKSKFFETLSHCLSFDQAVSKTCQFFSHPVSDLCIVMDMLFFLHMPPPPTVVTFHDYFEHLWRQTVGKYALQKNAAHVYLVFDKPDFLPPPRAIVHKSRGKRAENSIINITIRDDAAIPHNTAYSSLLAKSSTFKQQLLEYVTTQFKNKASKTTTTYNFVVTIDSPSLTSVLRISNGVISSQQSNEHGEADYAMWHHCILDPSSNFLIISSDTDTWVYGLGLYEQGYLDRKQVLVQRGNTDCYIDIRAATTLLSQHPNLSAFSFPVLSLVALYILTGCDYVSAFYRCSKTCFLETLIQDAHFICPDGNLLRMINNEFQHINEQSWVRLVTAVYYSKFKKFFRSRSINESFSLISSHSDSPEAKRMLAAVQYTPSSRTSLSMWHEFLRRVTYHIPKVTKYHEHKLLPSYQALVLHCKRANYVLKLTMSSPWSHSPFLACFEQFGWHKENGNILISWDAEDHLDSDTEDSDSASELSEGSNSSEESSD